MVSLFFLLLMALPCMGNPLILCLYLVFMAVILSFVMYSEISVWALNALVLIFLGGMMVLFLYLSTLSNYLKVYLPAFSFNSALVSLLSLALVLNLNLEGWGVKPSSVAYYPNGNLPMSSFTCFFFNMNGLQLLFIVTLLLLTLFTVVKLTESFKGSLMKSVGN